MNSTNTPIHDLSNNPEFQPFKYNEKEFDMNKIHEDRKELLDNQYDNKEERRVIKGSETKTAKKIHQGVRTNHKGTIYLVKDPRFTK